MTGFDRKEFVYGGGFLTYPQNDQRKVVARFKYNKRDKSGFVTFLIKNFSVEEYFSRMDAGETPLKILQSKGYVSKTIQMALAQQAEQERLSKISMRIVTMEELLQK